MHHCPNVCILSIIRHIFPLLFQDPGTLRRKPRLMQETELPKWLLRDPDEVLWDYLLINIYSE